MMQTLRTAVVAITLTLLTCAAHAADKDAPEFAVSGYGKVFYMVDMADLRFSVSVRAPDVQDAKRKHDEIIAELQEYLQEKDYAKELLSLEGTILKRERGSSGKPHDDFYLAQSVFSLRTKRIDELSALQADIVEIGVDEIQFVNLFSSQMRDLESDAQRLAIADAKRRAELTAGALDWRLGRATKVTYAEYPWQVGVHGFGTRAGSAGQAPIATSANFVEAKVQVTFTYDAGVEDEKGPVE